MMSCPIVSFEVFFFFLLEVLSRSFFLLLLYVCLLAPVWNLIGKSLRELFAILIEVIWCSRDQFNSKRLTIQNTIFQWFRIFWIYMKEVLAVIAFLIFVIGLLFWIATTVSRNVMLVCDIFYLNLIELCFLFKLFKQFVSRCLLSVHIKNIWSMNHN